MKKPLTIEDITAGITQDLATTMWFDETRWWSELEEANPEYPKGFFDWLEVNPHVFGAFMEVVDRLRKHGRTHYSAQTIIGYLRNQSDLGELGQSTLKINNNAASGLARIAVVKRPELKGFFKTRSRAEREEAIQLDGTAYGEGGDDAH